jgi:hypothetical protein
MRDDVAKLARASSPSERNHPEYRGQCSAKRALHFGPSSSSSIARNVNGVVGIAV